MVVELSVCVGCVGVWVGYVWVCWSGELMVWDRGIGLERREEIGEGGKVNSCGVLGPLARRGVAKPPAGTLPCPWYQWCVIVMCDSDRLE